MLSVETSIKFPALVLKGVFTLRVVKTMNASLDCLPGN